MAEEMKKETVATEVERGTIENPKELWKYVVVAKDVGRDKPVYDFEGLPVGDGETPSIDRPHIATDIVELGRRLDHQMIVEEATIRATEEFFKILQQQYEQQQPVETDLKEKNA